MLANNTRSTMAPGPTTTPSAITNATTTRIPSPTSATTSATNEKDESSLSTTMASYSMHPHTPPFPSASNVGIGELAPADSAPKSANSNIDITLENSISAQQSNPTISTGTSNGDDNQRADNIGPLLKRAKTRPGPFYKPILLSADRRNPDERTNVSKNPSNALVDNPALSGHMGGGVGNVGLGGGGGGGCGGSLGQAGSSYSREMGIAASSQAARDDASRKPEGLTRREWRLILIDYNHYLPGPGWNSAERSAQAERETYVLGAIDLPGQPSTLDEPDGQESQASRAQRNDEGVKIIPLDNQEGMYTFFPDPSGSEIVNGVLRWTTNR